MIFKEQTLYKYNILQNGSIDCSMNSDAGKTNQCLCDVSFANKIGQIWSDENYDMFFWSSKHNKGAKFDKEKICRAKPHPKVDSTCCGEFPNRRPMNLNTHSCCGNKVVWKGSMDVCD